MYLDSFLPEHNQVYRERREHDCSCCRHFIKNIGNTVIIVNNEIKTLWDFECNSIAFKPVINALAILTGHPESNLDRLRALPDMLSRIGDDKLPEIMLQAKNTALGIASKFESLGRINLSIQTLLEKTLGRQH